jgi:putative hydrolase of HD superfamily
MKKPDPLLFTLQQLSIDVALINRNHYLAGTSRRENDIEHSYSVALLCWFIHDKYQIPLDVGRILKYALAHDLVERYAGDTNTYASKEDRQKKTELERGALEKFSREFVGFTDLITTMSDYEAKKDEESLFVWSVDKMQQLVMGDMDSWRPYREIDVSYERFKSKCSEHLRDCSPYCKEIFSGLIEYSSTTFYDRPG